MSFDTCITLIACVTIVMYTLHKGVNINIKHTTSHTYNDQTLRAEGSVPSPIDTEDKPITAEEYKEQQAKQLADMAALVNKALFPDEEVD